MHYATLLVDEFISILNLLNIINLADYYNHWDEVKDTHPKLFQKYRRKFKKYVGS